MTENWPDWLVDLLWNALGICLTVVGIIFVLLGIAMIIAGAGMAVTQQEIGWILLSILGIAVIGIAIAATSQVWGRWWF